MAFLKHSQGTGWLIALHDKGGDRFEKGIITEAAIAYFWANNLRPEHCFSNRDKDVQSWFKPFTGDCLRSLRADDKLYIVAHASQTMVGPYTAPALANELDDRGLTGVGLIAFMACDVGVGSYLEEFARAVRGKFSVGWVKGYCGTAQTIAMKGKNNPKAGRPHEKIRHDGVVLEGSDRVKILRVNGIESMGDRYQGIV